MHLSTKVSEVAPHWPKNLQEYQLVHVITSATKQLPMLDVLWENCCHWVVNVIEVDLILKFLQKTYVACNRAFWTGWHDESSNKYMASHGPLTRYIKLRVAHAPGMPGTFSLSPTSKETDSYRSRNASRHMRDTRAVMHVGIANLRWRGNVPGIPGACATSNLRIW